MPEEILTPQVETHGEHNSSPWPNISVNPGESGPTDRQLELRTRIAAHLEAQRQLELEIARKAEEQRIQAEKERLEQERKALAEEIKKERIDFDPILISLVRRAMPSLIAYDIMGVQPMSKPTGLIFAMRSHYEMKDESGKPLVKAPDNKTPLSDEGEWCATGRVNGWYESDRRTVNSATRKKQAEQAAIEREEMRKKYAGQRERGSYIPVSREVITSLKEALDESKNDETMNKPRWLNY